MNDYIATMRKIIGHETLFTVGCGMILEDERGRILLQRRKDEDTWCLPGGIMEIGETFIETALRETEEETGLIVKNPQLFGIYSGKNCFAHYPNGDKTYSVQIVFYSNEFHGTLKQEGAESWEHRFFTRDSLPHPLNNKQKPFILDWKNEMKRPIVS